MFENEYAAPSDNWGIIAEIVSVMKMGLESAERLLFWPSFASSTPDPPPAESIEDGFRKRNN